MNSQFLDSDSESEEIPSSISRSWTSFNVDPFSPPDLYGSAFDSAILQPSHGESDANRPSKVSQYQRFSGDLSGKHASSLHPAPASLLSMEYKVSQKLGFAIPTRRFSSIHNPPCKQAHLGLTTKLERDFISAAHQGPSTVRSRYNNLGLPERPQVDSNTCTGNRSIDTNPTYDDWSLASASGSTALTTHSRSDSDGVPESLCDIAAFDFPEPPPIGSPIIRRMRSSPWFMAEDNPSRSFSDYHCRSRVAKDSLLLQTRRHSCSPEVEINTHISASCWTENGNLVEAGKATEPYGPHTGQPKGKKFDLELATGAFDGLEMSVSHPTLLDRDMYRSREFITHGSAPDLLWSSSYRDLGRSSMPMPRTLHVGDDSRRKAREDPPQIEAQDSRSFGPLPRIIRKVASMKSDIQKVNIPNYQTSGGTRRTIPKARSFRSILQPSEAKHGSRSSEIDIPAHQNIWPLANTSRNPNRENDPGPYLNGKNKQAWHHHLSGPLSGLGTSYKDRELPYALEDAPRGLARPFMHRSTDKNAFQKTASTGEQVIASKSFIDITPVQGAKSAGGAKRERVKNLIAKAGNGILGWGKWRTKGSTAS